MPLTAQIHCDVSDGVTAGPVESSGLTSPGARAPALPHWEGAARLSVPPPSSRAAQLPMGWLGRGSSPRAAQPPPCQPVPLPWLLTAASGEPFSASLLVLNNDRCQSYFRFLSPAFPSLQRWGFFLFFF